MKSFLQERIEFLGKVMKQSNMGKDQKRKFSKALLGILASITTFEDMEIPTLVMKK